MTYATLIVALSSLPALLGLFATPLTARMLTGIVPPGRWTLAVVAWAIVSTLAFAAWFVHGVNSEIAAHAAGPFRQNGVFLIFGFVFWNGVLILAVNAIAGIVGLILRRRRQ